MKRVLPNEEPIVLGFGKLEWPSEVREIEERPHRIIAIELPFSHLVTSQALSEKDIDSLIGISTHHNYHIARYFVEHGYTVVPLDPAIPHFSMTETKLLVKAQESSLKRLDWLNNEICANAMIRQLRRLKRDGIVPSVIVVEAHRAPKIAKTLKLRFWISGKPKPIASRFGLARKAVKAKRRLTPRSIRHQAKAKWRRLTRRKTRNAKRRIISSLFFFCVRSVVGFDNINKF